QKIPSNHIILVKAADVCGAEETYSVEANRFTDRQLDWIRMVLHFVLNVDSITFPDGRGGFDFASDTGGKVSQTEMAKLLANPDFSKWVGSEIVKAIRAVSDALVELDKYRTALKPGKTSSEYLNDTKPVVQKYWDAQIDLLKKLTSKLKITSTDTGADCN
ncbi:MAG TPA: hypothetical protein VFM35_02535, partial [Candidatus Binatia bacterium]|nr:hypothetical protein [Candidatus Binatia bacterium]